MMGLPEGWIQVGHRMVPDETDYPEVDRTALAWRLVSQGCDDCEIAIELGVDIEMARAYRAAMPKWWDHEYRRAEE